MLGCGDMVEVRVRIGEGLELELEIGLKKVFENYGSCSGTIHDLEIWCTLYWKFIIN